MFLLLIEQVADLKLRPDASCEYLLFQLPSRQEPPRLIQRRAVYDDGYYRVFEKPESQAN